jgi:hypothetical protein
MVLESNSMFLLEAHTSSQPLSNSVSTSMSRSFSTRHLPVRVKPMLLLQKVPSRQ